jgi:hypothetical protein
MFGEWAGGGRGVGGGGNKIINNNRIYIASKADLYGNRIIICHDLTPKFGS